ncbi:MAG TPA: glutamyl-tRNA reductase [Opitutaceae bacterium]|nr:glutamyl-tRNA reductase [Opitutaceae bacterium]
MQLLPLATEFKAHAEACPDLAHLVEHETSHRCLAPETIEEHRQGTWGLVGLNHRSATIELRSRAALSADSCRMFLRRARESGLDECAVLSTCNRTEVYFSGGSLDSVRHALSAVSGIPLVTLRPHLYASNGICTACHFVRVVAGLDSAVLGETEIVAQVKDAWRIAREESASGPMLDLLFRKGLEAGKRIRSQTELCRSATSLGVLAVRRAAERLGGLEGKIAVVIGAGQVAERVAKELAGVEGCRIRIVNRTLERATSLAASLKVHATPCGWESLAEQVDEADAVFCGVSVDRPILVDADFHRAGSGRSGRQLVVVDFGVPPNAHTEHAPDWLCLLNVDQLRDESSSNEARKLAALSPALDIVGEELKRFSYSLIEKSAAPLIRRISSRSREIETLNLAWASERLSHLSEKDWEVVRQLATRIVRGMLKDPIEQLKSCPPSDAEKALISNLFGLEETTD